MSLASLTRKFKSKNRTSHSTARRRLSLRPQLEALEARDLPSFAAPVAVGTNNFATLSTADANGDGKPDFITMNRAGTGGFGYLNNGNGTFVQGLAFFDWGGQTPTAMAVGDVNGDGKLDFVFSNAPPSDTGFPTPPTITVGLGNGQGFTPAISPLGQEGVFPAPVSSMTLADMYGHGKLDIVAVGTYGGLYLAQGYSNGLFVAAKSVGNPGFRSPVLAQFAVADVNGDGRPDIIVTSPGLNSVSVLMNNGNGSFAPAQTYAVGATPTGVAVGDFNHDGKLDIVTTNSNGTVSVLMNTGAGAFGAASSYSISGPANSVAVGDFNHDGYMDIATTGSTEMEVLLNNGDGTFGPYQNVGPAGSSIVAADFNGDGFPDLAELVGTGLFKNIDVLMNKADWTPTPSFAVASFPSSTKAGIAHTFIVTALNANGTIDTGYSGTVHFTSSDLQAVLPANSTLTNGVGTFQLTLETAGNQSIRATDPATGNMTGSETGIIVTPAAASNLVVAGFPSASTAGVAGSFTVTARDPYGNIATGYLGTVHFTSSDGKASLPANYTFTAGDAGVHTFSATLKRAGTQSITATDAVFAAINGSETGIQVNPAAASRLALTAPSTVTAGAPFSITVTALDAYGNVATGYRGIIRISSVNGQGNLPSTYTFTAADNGVHTFTGVVLQRIAKHTITMTDTLNGTIVGRVIVDVL
jgi:hypothetical protein